MKKPLIIGMNNPISSMVGHELYPAPEGCTGHRLWRMLNARTGCSRQEYLSRFERRNLVTGKAWDTLSGRARAHEIACELEGSGRVVVLLGESVRKSFGHPRLPIHPQEIGGTTWRQLPHPSGRNLWYNVPENVKVAELLLEELYLGKSSGVAKQGSLL